MRDLFSYEVPMASQKIRDKRKMKRQRDLQKEKIEASELLTADDDGLEIVEKETESEDLEKDYAMAAPGPTSYEELDAAKAAREQAEHVMHESWTVQDLVYNIAHSMLTPDEKSKAIVKVGKDFGSRLKMIASGKMEKEFDFDVLEIKAVLGRDSRHTSIIEKTINLFSSSPENVLRKQLKDIAKVLESDPENEVRSSVPELLKAAKEAKIGGEPCILIEKDATGSWRAVLLSSNNFKDRDGEIIAQSAHEEYVDWVNKNMPDAAPVFATWHVPGTARTHPIDFVGFENGFLIDSCPLTESEAASLLKMQETIDLGLSIGGIALARDPADPRIITKYRRFEVSDLPLARAANPFTDIELVSKEADMKPEQMKEYLTGMLGPERAEAVLTKMAISQDELRKAGVEEKEKKTPETPATTVVNTAAPSVNMDELIEKVAKELGMKELSDEFVKMQEAAEKVPVLEELVKQLLTSKEDDLAEMISPPISKQLAWKNVRASQKDETILKDDEKDKELKKAAPETGWLSEATHTTPVVV